MPSGQTQRDLTDGLADLRQPRQGQQVRHPERAPASCHRHEHIWPGRIRPAHRKRVLPALGVEEEHPVLGPGLADRHEHELPPRPRVERVSYPHNSLRGSGIRRS